MVVGGIADVARDEGYGEVALEEGKLDDISEDFSFVIETRALDVGSWYDFEKWLSSARKLNTNNPAAKTETHLGKVRLASHWQAPGLMPVAEIMTTTICLMFSRSWFGASKED